MKRLILLVLWLTSCNLGMDATPENPLPAAPVTPGTAIATPAQSSEGWEILSPGLERRIYTPGGNFLAQIVALRINPARYTFRAHYQPGAALSAGEWRAQLPGATAFINANFFDPANTVQGLLVADSQVYGQSYQTRGGTFAVQDGLPRIRSNASEPYSGEPLEQAVQAFPMLVVDGNSVRRDDWGDRPTRRSAIAQDEQGRVILLATPLLGLSLGELSTFLAEADMNIVNAFNLDGGGSTMLHIGPADYLLRSIDPVPAVLAVYPKP